MFDNNITTQEELEDFLQSDNFKKYKADFEIESATSMNSNPEEINVNMQGKSVQEILGLNNLRTKRKKEPIIYSFNAIKHYDIDIEIYEDIVEQSPVIQETQLKGEALLPSFKYLQQDLFLSLYKFKVEAIPEEQMHLSSKVNRKILGKVINTPEYISLRESCRLDQFNAALGTEILSKEILDALEQEMQNLQDQQKQMQALQDLNQAEQQLDQVQQMIQAIQDGSFEVDGQEFDPNDYNVEQLEENAETLRQLAEQISKQCDDIINKDDVVQNVTRVLGASLDSANQQVSEISNTCAAWGFGQPGGKNLVSIESKKAAIEKIRQSRKLTDLTDMVGRFKETAKAVQKKKSKHGAVEIKSVTTGDQIQDTLPSDRMNLCNEITKKDFHRRMTEHGLLQYSKESSKEMGKGPIIVCVDTSGSMSGNRELWSKALTVGILEIAQLQKRDFACILYSDYANAPIVINKNEISPEKILKCAEEFSGGGTSFEAPLREAMKLIEDSKFKNADILFLTDGDCYVSESFIKEYKKIKEQKEFSTLGVIINSGRHCSDDSLKDFCDSITKISDLTDITESNNEANTAIFNAF